MKCKFKCSGTSPGLAAPLSSGMLEVVTGRRCYGPPDASLPRRLTVDVVVGGSDSLARAAAAVTTTFRSR